MRSSPRFAIAMPGHIVLILTSLSPFSKAKADYFIQSISIGESLCNTDLVAGDVLPVAWTVENISGTGNDTCWLAIRPTWDTVDANAYVNGSHVRCSFTSTNIQIPLAPADKSLPYNGSSYSVRLISPAPNNVMLDSCPFKIQKQGWKPSETESDIVAKKNMYIAGFGLAIAIIAAVLGVLLAHYLKQRHQPRHVPVAQDP